MRHKVKHIHFVGIAGAGMSGIAEVLLTLGYQVSGSDIAQNLAARRLSQLGAKIYQGHAASHLGDADVVVVSSAIDVDNPEVNMARERAIPVVPRAEMLSELMKLKQGIAVAGTHGKTTTTSLITTLLAAGGLDPTYVIGGQLRLMTPEEAAGTNGFLSGSHARLGQGDFLVAEADESDASFLHLSPVISVVTNIDQDHMETYGHDPARLQQTFIDFIHRLPFYGVAVMCTDDAGVMEILPRLSKQVVRYGLNADAQIRAEDIHTDGLATTFVLVWANGTIKRQPVRLNLVGEHNVRNALAAFAVGLEVGIAPKAMVEAMANFRGVERRFQVFDPIPLGENGGGTITLVDDYGHHPVEISATLQAARLAFPGRRLVLAFQPHRYTRTRDCFEEFVAVLATVDELFLTEVYAASEKPIVGSDSKALLRALRLSGQTSVHFVPNVEELPGEMLSFLQDQDVALVMGAGSIGQIVPRLIPYTHLFAS